MRKGSLKCSTHSQSYSPENISPSDTAAFTPSLFLDMYKATSEGQVRKRTVCRAEVSRFISLKLKKKMLLTSCTREETAQIECSVLQMTKEKSGKQGHGTPCLSPAWYLSACQPSAVTLPGVCHLSTTKQAAGEERSTAKDTADETVPHLSL